MKCPKCGAYIPEGNLYCGKCGTEISFVPEFEPEVENRISESLSGVANNLKDDIFKTRKLFEDSSSNRSHYDRRTVLLTSISAVIIIAVALCLSFLLLKGLNSAKSYEEQAQDYYVAGKFDKAITAIDKAIENTEDTETIEELMFKRFAYEIEGSYRDEAIGTLTELTDSNIFSESTVNLATEELIKLYIEDENYEEVAEIVAESSSAQIKAKYSDYIPMKPVIYPDEGEYDKVLEISITTQSDGDIYYTVNGSDPDGNSIKYEDVLTLEEEGDYVIKAICINKYGLHSDVATSIFSIENMGPAAPEIMEDSGEYTQSTMIVAVCDAGCKIYYTTDGSDPTAESRLYVSPISMPVGTTHFKFVAVDQDGNLSEIVEKDYHLSYSTLVSVDQARASIIQILVKLDILLDSTGKMRSEEGYFDYVYDREIEITGSGSYYVFVEKHVYNDGTVKETGLLYAVNTHDGKVNRLGYDSSGNYTLITISNR